MASLVVAEGPEAVSTPMKLSADILQQIDAASTTAQSECLAFSELMYTKLPKEVRDLVYSYICLEDRRIPIGPYYHFRKYQPLVEGKVLHSDTQYCPRDGDLQTELADGKTRIDHDIYPEEDLILPGNHIFSPSYMGQEVALEMLKLYYRGNSFSVCNIEGGLDSLCTVTSLGTESSTPAFVPIDHVRDLQLRIKCEHFTKCVSELEEHTSHLVEKIVEVVSDLRGTVESLQAFRTRMSTSSRELNMEIVLMTDLEKVWGYGNGRECPISYITNVLQSIRNMVYELLHDHKHVTIRVTHQDDGLMAFPKNYSGLFNLTKEQWNYEQSKHLRRQDWANDFWILPMKSEDLPDSDRTRLGGYCTDSLDKFLASRWGVDDILRETVSTKPALEGPYWPVGRPFDFSFTEYLCNKPKS